MRGTLALLRLCSIFTLATVAIFAPGCGRSSLFDSPGCVGNCTPTGFDLAGDDLAGDDLAGIDFAVPPPGNDGGDAFATEDLLGIDGAEDGGVDGPPANVDLSVPCFERMEICDNGIDDNCNGLVDCQDPACNGDVHCAVKGHEICNNGIDDDDNGLTDCQDPACADFPACQMPKMCDPNHVDCTNPLCVNNPACQNLVCKPTVDFGTLAAHDSTSEKMISTVGTMDVTMSGCAPGGGGQVVTQFTVATDQTPVRLDYQQSPDSDHVFALFRAGVGQACDANPVNCYDPMSAASGHTIWVLPAGHYYLVVAAFTVGHQGLVDATLSTPPKGVETICNNGIDDDGNGLTDCQDPACFANVACKNKECNPNQNVGTLVVGDPPKMAQFTTNPADNNYKITCGGSGGDYAVEFTLAEAAGIGMDFMQSGDHLIGLFRKPPAGENCDAIQTDCADPGGLPQLSYAWGDYSAGTYIFIFKAHQPGTEGSISVNLYAYATRKVELCHNGIDDDDNGLTDCQDPACFNDPGCGAPVCMPDLNIGTLNPGQMVMTTVDTSTGILNLTSSCSGTGGKAKIIQLDLAQPGGLIVNCNEQSGQAILGLFFPGAPRDPCDKNEVSCADPSVLPFMCNFILPNLQAGTYYFMVQAFNAGDEGVVNLTLGAETERTLEICNNGIDDDMNGFTDCADLKCVTSPYCTPKACKPDVGIDPLPLNGMPTIVNVDTVGKQVTVEPPCEITQGGGDAVIYLNLIADANVTADWSQAFSSHVFAIYPDLGQGLICDAGKSLLCVQSNGMDTGTITFPRLTAGKYWVVVAADKPGDEGSATLRFKGMP